MVNDRSLRNPRAKHPSVVVLGWLHECGSGEAGARVYESRVRQREKPARQQSCS
jgi:hypothetical protein